MRLRCSPLVLLACFVLGPSDPAAGLVIDDFEDADFSLTNTTGASLWNTQEGVGVLGGVRETVLRDDGTVSVAGGDLVVAPAPGVRVDLIYDAIGNDTWDSVGDLGIDLTADGADGFLLDFGSVSGALSITVFVSDGGATHVEFLSEFTPSGVVEVPFTAFPTADLTTVGTIAVAFAYLETGDDFFLESFSTGTVPEPAGLLLLASASCGLRVAVARRSRRRLAPRPPRRGRARE